MLHLTVADVITIISALVAIEMAIGHGTIVLTNAIPDKYEPAVKAWCNILAGVGSIVITFLSRAVVLLLAVVLVFGAGQASAADLKATPAAAAPVAPPVTCTINGCTGFYAGADIVGAATNVNVFLNGIAGSLNAGGTDLGGHVGYRAWNGKFYLGAELGCGYDISSGIGAIGASSSDRLRCLELLKAGGAISALLGGNAQPVTFPAALQSSFMSGYAILGAAQHGSKTGIAGGVGAEFVLMPNWTMTLEYINAQYSGSGGAGANVSSDNLFRLGFNYNF